MFWKLFTIVFGICSFATFIAFCHNFLHRTDGQLWQLELELFFRIFYIFPFVWNLTVMVSKHQATHGIYEKCLFFSRERKKSTLNKK